ncbi:hypothetical protein GT354_16740, partial [Streptomyces sp. SID3343]|nr:hypothetical protein [Streptomyces sp. SID3343]
RLTLAALPPPVGARVATYLADPTAVTTMVSTMDLGPEPLHHAGAPALAATMFAAPPSGVRCYSALARHGDTVRLSVYHDEALTHLAHLGEYWLAALADLAPPGGPGNRPRQPTSATGPGNRRRQPTSEADPGDRHLG